MAEAARSPWTIDEFFAWQELQDEKYELVDGQPQLLRSMAGASRGHVRISVNLLGQLYVQLKGSQCQPFHGDGSVNTRPGQIRRPDIGVDCGPFIQNGYVSESPRMVAEVLSPSTRSIDLLRKLEEYKLIPGLQYILLIEPSRPEIAIWRRDGAGPWVYSLVQGIEAAIAMPGIGVVLPMTEIYAGITFAPELRIVKPQ